MPFKLETELLPLSVIKTLRDGRQRREIKVDDLLESIKSRGLINPIVVRREGEEVILVAGERRLEAHRVLGLAVIPCREFASLDPIDQQIIELEENIKRSDLVWQDLVRAIARIHALYVLRDQDWEQQQTAGACGVSKGLISMYLSVVSSLEDENVAKSGTVKEAYNLLLRRKARAEGDFLQELIEGSAEVEPSANAGPSTVLGEATPAPSPDSIVEETSSAIIKQMIFSTRALAPAASPPSPSESILNASMLDWLPLYEGKKFNLLHCDFPYGIGLFNSNGIRAGESRSQMGRDEGEEYADDEGTYRALVECLCGNINRVLSFEAHIMFWFSNKFEIEKWTRECFARLAPSVSWARFPLIWHKSDNTGLASRPKYEPRHVYEACMLGSRGRRNIVKIKSDVYSAPTDKSIHTSAKPQPMLAHFMEMLVDEHTSLLDLTCGSGSALRAAEALGANRVLGLEIDPSMVKAAREALALDRMKRKAAGVLRA